MSHIDRVQINITLSKEISIFLFVWQDFQKFIIEIIILEISYLIYLVIICICIYNLIYSAFAIFYNFLYKNFVKSIYIRMKYMKRLFLIILTFSYI